MGRVVSRAGTVAQPGSSLITLLGPVGHQGVYEIDIGAALSTVIDAAGGLSGPPRALLVGGYAGTWIDAEALSDINLCDEELEPYGASFGAGVVIVLGQEACGVAETVRVARWMADQSAGQCGPCVHGLDALATVLEETVTGVAGSDPQRRIDELQALVRVEAMQPSGRSRPIHRQRHGRLEHEIQWHAQNGPCAKCRRPASCRCLEPPRSSHAGDHDREQPPAREPIACEAHGMRAELLPERITLDPWGYPILDGKPIAPGLLAHARRAAEACPTFALLIERREG